MNIFKWASLEVKSGSLYLWAAGGWSGDSAGNGATLVHDAIPVRHSGPDTVSGPALLPREPSLPTHQPGGGE